LAVGGSAPAWSPDGSTISYAAGGLWLTDADGWNPRQLVLWLSTQEQEVSSPAWSPDGTQIVFVGVPGEGAESIWVVDADGENLRQITTGQVTTVGFMPAWSRGASLCA
jgi:Tol biopolymer transport system component